MNREEAMKGIKEARKIDRVDKLDKSNWVMSSSLKITVEEAIELLKCYGNEQPNVMELYKVIEQAFANQQSKLDKVKEIVIRKGNYIMFSETQVYEIQQLLKEVE